MEPQTHRLDREALFADRLETTLRVRRETDEIVAAAEAKRRAFVDRLIAELRADIESRLEREQVVTDLLEAAASHAVAARRGPLVAAGRSEDADVRPSRPTLVAAG